MSSSKQAQKNSNQNPVLHNTMTKTSSKPVSVAQTLLQGTTAVRPTSVVTEPFTRIESVISAVPKGTVIIIIVEMVIPAEVLIPKQTLTIPTIIKIMATTIPSIMQGIPVVPAAEVPKSMILSVWFVNTLVLQ